MKLIYEPLFTSYVFVKVEEGDIFLLEQTDGVMSIVYWKGEPAWVREVEIEAIKELIKQRMNIKLERIDVNMNSETKNNDTIFYASGGKILIIDNSTVKVSLPSLGFTMIAEIDSYDRLRINERSQEQTFQAH